PPHVDPLSLHDALPISAAAGDGAVTGTVYNVGCNGRTTLKSLFAMIRDGLARDFPHVAGAEPAYEAPRAGDIQHSQASIDKITRSEEHTSELQSRRDLV